MYRSFNWHVNNRYCNLLTIIRNSRHNKIRFNGGIKLKEFKDLVKFMKKVVRNQQLSQFEKDSMMNAVVNTVEQGKESVALKYIQSVLNENVNKLFVIHYIQYEQGKKFSSTWLDINSFKTLNEASSYLIEKGFRKSHIALEREFILSETTLFTSSIIKAFITDIKVGE